MNTRPKSPGCLIDQTKSFFAPFTSGEYTDVRVYSRKKLMRALGEPYLRDIKGLCRNFVYKCSEKIGVWDEADYIPEPGDENILKNRPRNLSWTEEGTDEVKDSIKKILEQQMRDHIDHQGNIEEIDMEMIRKEYIQYMRSELIYINCINPVDNEE